jgi:protein SCO1
LCDSCQESHKEMFPLPSGEGEPRRYGVVGEALLILLVACTVFADSPDRQNNVLSQVKFDQKLDAQVPLQLPFRDSNGETVQLSKYFQGKPVVLSLVYYRCPMLCTEALNGILRAMRGMKLTAGNEFQVATVSFDPKEEPSLAAAKKRVYLERYHRASAETGWAFLTGEEANIRKLTDSVGFKYAYDAELAQYAHSTGIVILTPEGRVSRYLFGVEYSARDLKLALLEASKGKIGTPADAVLLYCYKYDPASGKYNLQIMRTLRVAAAGTVMVLAIIIGLFLWQEKKSRLKAC